MKWGKNILDDGRIAVLSRALDCDLPEDYQRDWCNILDHDDSPGYLGHY
jgi:hypothetical protein